MALLALGRNTPLILTSGHAFHPAAGPGTERYFHETAAGSIPVVACGGHKLGGTRTYSIGQTPDYGSPLESDFLGAVCQASRGLDIERANDVAVRLLERYETRTESIPEGHTMGRLYDIEKARPSDWYREIYDRVAGELRNRGVSIADYQA